MIVQSAKEAVRVDQQLNDYIAHEVLNPLAAVICHMYVCTFLKVALEANEWLLKNASIQHVQEEVDIIKSSQ
jgi:hypothetical protein